MVGGGELVVGYGTSVVGRMAVIAIVVAGVLLLQADYVVCMTPNQHTKLYRCVMYWAVAIRWRIAN